MNKTVRFTLAALVLAAASGAAQAGVIANWGSISAPGATYSLGNSFSSTTASFSDDYLFSLGGSGGSTGDLDTFEGLLSYFDIEITSIKLFKDGNLFGTDSTPTSGFSFSGLTAGNYALRVGGNVTKEWSLFGGLLGTPVGYNGSVSISVSGPSTSNPASVPEPATFALLSAGLAAVGFLRRRKPVES